MHEPYTGVGGKNSKITETEKGDTGEEQSQEAALCSQRIRFGRPNA
jgi:hypothetical protein